MNVREIEHPVFDYEKQVWIQRGRYLRCGHPDITRCGCYGREHCGEDIDAGSEQNILEQIEEVTK